MAAVEEGDMTDSPPQERPPHCTTQRACNPPHPPPPHNAASQAATTTVCFRCFRCFRWVESFPRKMWHPPVVANHDSGEGYEASCAHAPLHPPLSSGSGSVLRGTTLYPICAQEVGAHEEGWGRVPAPSSRQRVADKAARSRDGAARHSINFRFRSTAASMSRSGSIAAARSTCRHHQQRCTFHTISSTHTHTAPMFGRTLPILYTGTSQGRTRNRTERVLQGNG